MQKLSDIFGRRKLKLSQPGPRAPLRVLQVTIAASCGLLFLKLGGLVTHGGYSLTELNKPNSQFARVLSNIRSNDEPQFTGSVQAKKEGEKTAENAKPKEGDDIKLPTDFKEPQKSQVAPASPAELQILQRLRERRDTLEQRAQELDIRENLLKATERKVEDRIGTLKGEEAKAPGQPFGSDEDTAKQMKTLVTIYENMKPKDAARVFDKLDLKVLVAMINHMNPRKLSEIVSAMSPDVAQRLTVALATRQIDPVQTENARLPPGELPRVEVPRRAP